MITRLPPLTSCPQNFFEARRVECLGTTRRVFSGEHGRRAHSCNLSSGFVFASEAEAAEGPPSPPSLPLRDKPQAAMQGPGRSGGGGGCRGPTSPISPPRTCISHLSLRACFSGAARRLNPAQAGGGQSSPAVSEPQKHGEPSTMTNSAATKRP